MKKQSINTNSQCNISIKELLKYIIWDMTTIINKVDNSIILSTYYDWEKDYEISYDSEKLSDLSSLIRDIIWEGYNKFGCDNLYTIKGIGAKFSCKKHYLEKVWRLLYEIQSWYNTNNKENIDNAKEMIENLQKYIEEENNK